MKDRYPAVEELAQVNLNVTNKTIETPNANNLPADELAVALDINLDEINRWRAGKYNSA